MVYRLQKKIIFTLLSGLLILTPQSSGTAVTLSSRPVGLAAENIFVDLADKVVPSVVNISSIYTIKNPILPPEEFFRYFFGDLKGQQIRRKLGSLKAMSLGSGVIIDPSGIILTNNHVVAGADEIKIQFTEEDGEKPVDGKVVGRDPELDVALIKVNTTHQLTSLSLGDSDRVKVGEYVMAVGNPFGQGHSASHGIVSAKGRLNPDFPMGNYIQTDAPINPGNSGGPLVNLNGEVIGINTAIQQNAQGIGFAITSNLVKQILPQLETYGVVERGYIGILVGPLTPQGAEAFKVPEGAPVVRNVSLGGPAYLAGLRKDDIIIQFNGTPVLSPSDLISRVINLKIGSKAPVLGLRDGKLFTFSVEIGKRPLDLRAAETQ